MQILWKYQFCMLMHLLPEGLCWTRTEYGSWLGNCVRLTLSSWGVVTHRHLIYMGEKGTRFSYFIKHNLGFYINNPPADQPEGIFRTNILLSPKQVTLGECCPRCHIIEIMVWINSYIAQKSVRCNHPAFVSDSCRISKQYVSMFYMVSLSFEYDVDRPIAINIVS